MTNKERLAHPCPKCHAKAGDPCTDPLGDVLPRCHQTRGPGQLEAHKAKEAERINARQLASYGPLFQGVAAAEVKPVTAAELIERDRRYHTFAPDMNGPMGLLLREQCNKGMEWVWCHYMVRECERLAGPPGRLFGEHALQTYPLDYQRMTFKEFLTTTRRREIGPYRTPADTPLGFKIAYRHTWEPATPLMTREEFDARYPAPDHWKGLRDASEPDDGGLFERTIGALRRSA